MFSSTEKALLICTVAQRGLILLKQRLLRSNSYTKLSITLFETSEDKLKETLLRLVNAIRGFGVKISIKQARRKE